MTVSRHLNQNIKLIVIRYSGKLNYAEMSENLEEVRTIKRSSEDIRSLLILEENTDLSALSTEEIVKLTTNSPLFSKNRHNIIVASESLAFGLSRMFASYGSGEKGALDVVKTIEDACKILGIRPEQVSAS